MSAYNEEMAKFRRLTILQLLSDAPESSLHEQIIKIELQKQSQGVSTDTLRADLEYLNEQGLAYLQKNGGIYLSTLTAKGDDVRQNLSNHPGVAKPGLK